MENMHMMLWVKRVNRRGLEVKAGTFFFFFNS